LDGDFARKHVSSGNKRPSQPRKKVVLGGMLLMLTKRSHLTDLVPQLLSIGNDFAEEDSLKLAIFEAPLLSISQDLEVVSIEGE